MYTLFSAQKRALTKISRKKKDFNESNVEHAFKAQQCRYSVWLLHTVFPIFLHFLFFGGGGGLSPLLDFQPIPPIYQLNYILAIGYHLPALSALQTP